MKKILRGRFVSPTGKPILVQPVWPNASVEVWYRNELLCWIADMYRDARKLVLPAANDTPPVVASDAALAAGIIFRAGDLILLVQRSNSGWWAFPGGSIEPNETPEETARRETFEELQYRYAGELHLERMQVWESVWFFTYVAYVERFEPVLNHEHLGYKWVTIEEALGMNLHPGVRSTLAVVPAVAMDASPTKQLQMALERWGGKWVKKFDQMSLRLSLDFASKNQRATQTSMQAQFKRAGFTIEFKPTQQSIRAYKEAAAEQVGLIKSIAQKFHTDVQTQVWQAVKRGSDLKTLSTKLEKTYGITKRRAAFIARDQNAKAKAVMEAVRHREIGIRQAIWMHSKAGKEPRPTHVKMNNRLYDLETGMYDPDEGEYVHPGELINCRCTMRPFIPGFEAPPPDFDVTQT